MATRNDVTGDAIVSRASNDKYADGWDRIFGKKKLSYEETTAKAETSLCVPEDASGILSDYNDPRWSKEKEFKLPAFTFTISAKQYEQVEKWLKEEVYPEAIALQKLDPRYKDWKLFMGENGEEYPYSGSIGCSETYSFTSTGLGTIIKVTAYGKTLDITDYDSF